MTKKQTAMHVSPETFSRLVEKFGPDGAEILIQALDERAQNVENSVERMLAMQEQRTHELVSKELFESHMARLESFVHSETERLESYVRSEVRRLEDAMQTQVKRLEDLIRTEIKRVEQMIEQKIGRIEDKLAFIVILIILGFTLFNPSFVELLKSLLK